MSSDIQRCESICETCPFNPLTEDNTVLIAEQGYHVPGTISYDGRSASFEFYQGKPVNIDQRVSAVALASSEGRVLACFQAPGKQLDDGTVVNRFNDCEGPREQRYGFLRLKKRLACSALQSFQS
jgi:hypothetical protein